MRVLLCMVDLFLFYREPVEHERPVTHVIQAALQMIRQPAFGSLFPGYAIFYRRWRISMMTSLLRRDS